MIHLDTNYLFLILAGDEAVEDEMLGWLQKGEVFAVSAIAWAEFCVQPIHHFHLSRFDVLIRGGIVAFGRSQAERAGELHLRLKLKREHRADCFIAATAILAGARLATKNRGDFRRFVPEGLTLA